MRAYLRNSDCSLPPQTCLLKEMGMGWYNKFHSGTSASWAEYIMYIASVLPASVCATKPSCEWIGNGSNMNIAMLYTVFL